MTDRLTLALLTMLMSACLDVEPRSEGTIERAQVIAIVADPPESSPGTPVRFRAIIADPTGPRDAPLRWSFCSTPRAASDNTAAAQACIVNAEQPLLASGTTIDTVIPADACMRFGSETPSGRAPNAADGTGGYYQPLRVALAPTELTLMRQRVRCALPNAPLVAARDFNRDYVPNRNPRVTDLRAWGRAGETDLTVLPSSAALTLQVEVAADAAESYLLYDPRAGTLTTATERLSLSWYVSAGRLAHATTALAGATADNRWWIDGAITQAWLWVVLRDDRGGTSAVVRALGTSTLPGVTDTSSWRSTAGTTAVPTNSTRPVLRSE